VLAARINSYSGSTQTIWNNQVELSKSASLLDEQFAVSTRMAVMGINLILDRIGAEERIKGEDLSLLFDQWATFKSRPDFRELMLEWMLGVPLDQMPELPAKKEVGETDAESDNGDEGSAEAEPQDSPPCQENDVPEVPSENRASG
jgi:hypothetical protein